MATRIGVVRTTVTYLEMTAKPARAQRPRPSGPFALMRVDPPDLAFYRFLYEQVGGPWLWTSRRLMSEDALAAAIQRPEIEISALYVAGNPAGFFELSRVEPQDVELAYFGLAPSYIGRGLGGYLLDAAIWQGFVGEARRLRVQTCDLDHPRALQNYQRAGFRPYGSEPGEVAAIEGLPVPAHRRDRAIEPD